MIAVVHSVRDPAGSGAAKALLDLVGGERAEVAGAEEAYELSTGALLVGFAEDVIYFEFLAERLPLAERFVVLSRHSSEARIKSYTVHFTGNFADEAKFGGRPGELGYADAAAGLALLRGLAEEAKASGRDKEYRVSYEATHHGPTGVPRPLVFVEIGSSPEEWVDVRNHEVLAGSVARFLESPQVACEPAIGVGGGHYPWKHTEHALNNGVCYGHIMPKYSLDALSRETLAMMARRTVPAPRLAVVERKGVNSEGRRIVEEFCREAGLRLAYI
ncbi:MAG: D-aminoacyl-tRNA deacylase [Desulfurococcaceae archaeon]